MVPYTVMAGKLIVIEGGEGSGKATQTERLVARLIREDYKVGTMDFPRKTHNVVGELIGECFEGQHGGFVEMAPKVASVLFAADRYESRKEIETWLEDDRIVIIDRYVSSNMLHQGAKFTDPEALDDFLNWVSRLEHDVFGMPRPDLVVYLNVPVEERIKLLHADVENRGHIIGMTEDTVEQQVAMQERAKTLMNKFNNWRMIDCVKDGEMRMRDDINDELHALVKEVM